MAFSNKANKPTINVNLGDSFKGKVPKSSTPSSISSSNHHQGNLFNQVLTEVIKGTGRKIGEQSVVKIVDGISKLIIDQSNDQCALSGLTNVSNLGLNQSTYTSSFFHIGPSTTKKLKQQANTPLVEFISKSLSSSYKDYVQHKKRTQLTLTTGFEQKGYSFLAEDTYLSVKDLLTLFGHDPKIRENIFRNKNGSRNVYGCLYNTHLNLKLSSGIDYYSLIVRIHLVQVTDIHDDFRTLVSECTKAYLIYFSEDCRPSSLF